MHLYDFFPSCTDSIWFFKLQFIENLASQTVHLYGFTFSCTDAIWVFKLKLTAKRASHTVHLYGFFSSCTDSICTFNLQICAKLVSQMVHLCGFCFSCTDAQIFNLTDTRKIQCKICVTNAASVSYAQMQHVFSNYNFVQSYHHNWCI